MAEISKVSGRPVIDYMARDFDSFLGSMRQLIPEKLPEWTDFESEADFGNVLLQLFAHMGDILSYYQDRVANESFLATAQRRRSVIQHLALIGYKLSTAAPAAAELRLTVPADFPPPKTSGELAITRGNAFATKSAKDRPSVRFEYTREEPLVIDFSDPGPEDPEDRRPWKRVVVGGKTVKRFDGIPVEEGRLVKDEILGTSDGTAGQSFRLVHPHLILRSRGASQAARRDIRVYSELGSKPEDVVREEWLLRESLAWSRGDGNDFVLDVDAEDRAAITFGDGELGRKPPGGAVLRATYRVGGGVLGNVAPNSIVTIADAPDLKGAGGAITNPGRATGGAEHESIAHAVAHAPGVFRSLKRAVTAADYVALARDFAGVGKVRAEATSWNTVTLYVAPEGGGQVSDVLEADLLAYFEDKRPLSTIVEIADVDYVTIRVTAEVTVEGTFSRETIRERVGRAAGALLAFDAVDFGRPLYLSKFYEQIEAVEGVLYAHVTEFRRAGDEDPIAGDEDLIEPSGKIELEPHELATTPIELAGSGGIQLTVEGGF